MTRWRVSDRGVVAHLRIGAQPLTVCGEAITRTGKPVPAKGENPPCMKCESALTAAREQVAEEKAKEK